MVIDEANLCLNHIVGAAFGVIGLATEGATVEVEDDGLGLAFRKSITMDARSRGGRELHIHTTLRQQHLIISRTSRFFVMAIMLPEVGGLQLFGSHCATQRHQTHIDEVGATRATEVGMGETVNDVFIVVVARARVPSHH